MSVGDNERLLQAALEGDKNAFGSLLESFRPYLLALARRYLDPRVRQRLDPADIVQTTFFEAQRDFDAFQGNNIAQFLGWLRNILRHNVYTAHQRHLYTEKRSADLEVSNRATDSRPAVTDMLPSETTSPSQRVIRKEVAQALHLLLDELPATQSEALRLRYIQGCSLREISVLMAKSETAVAGLLKRGLHTLRSRMQSDQSSFYFVRNKNKKK